MSENNGKYTWDVQLISLMGPITIKADDCRVDDHVATFTIDTSAGEHVVAVVQTSDITSILSADPPARA